VTPERLDYPSAPPPDARPARRTFATWMLLLAVWAVGLIVWAIYVIAIVYLLSKVL
jgi:hypothetical protein